MWSCLRSKTLTVYASRACSRFSNPGGADPLCIEKKMIPPAQTWVTAAGKQGCAVHPSGAWADERSLPCRALGGKHVTALQAGKKHRTLGRAQSQRPENEVKLTRSLALICLHQRFCARAGCPRKHTNTRSMRNHWDRCAPWSVEKVAKPPSLRPHATGLLWVACARIAAVPQMICCEQKCSTSTCFAFSSHKMRKSLAMIAVQRTPVTNPRTECSRAPASAPQGCHAPSACTPGRRGLASAAAGRS